MACPGAGARRRRGAGTRTFTCRGRRLRRCEGAASASARSGLRRARCRWRRPREPTEGSRADADRDNRRPTGRPHRRVVRAWRRCARGDLVRQPARETTSADVCGPAAATSGATGPRAACRPCRPLGVGCAAGRELAGLRHRRRQGDAAAGAAGVSGRCVAAAAASAAVTPVDDLALHAAAASASSSPRVGRRRSVAALEAHDVDAALRMLDEEALMCPGGVLLAAAARRVRHAVKPRLPTRSSARSARARAGPVGERIEETVASCGARRRAR